jgi:hypothetical protein
LYILFTFFSVVGKNILEIIAEKGYDLFGHVKTMPGNRLALKIFEWEPEGTREGEEPKTDG